MHEDDAPFNGGTSTRGSSGGSVSGSDSGEDSEEDARERQGRGRAHRQMERRIRSAIVRPRSTLNRRTVINTPTTCEGVILTSTLINSQLPPSQTGSDRAHQHCSERPGLGPSALRSGGGRLPGSMGGSLSPGRLSVHAGGARAGCTSAEVIERAIKEQAGPAGVVPRLSCLM